MKIPILTKFFKARAGPQNRFWSSAYSFFFGPASSGTLVNERTALQTSAVYACIRVLAEGIAALPLHTYRHTSQGKEKALDHHLYHLLHSEPNPEMTSFVFRETLMGHLLLWGNAYAQIIRDGRNRVTALYPLLPDRMEVAREGGQLVYHYNKEGEVYRLPAASVLHIPGLGFDGLVGYSPIALAKNAIGMAIATEEYGAAFFANGASPGGVLEHPGVVKDPAKLRESWNAVYQGAGKAHRVAVLEEGMKFSPMGIPPEQAQFLETRKFQLNEIARIFRVPPHLVGDLEKSSFSNIEQQSLEFVMYTLEPWVVRWEQAISRALFTAQEKKDYFVRFNLSGLLRGDYQSRMQGYAVGRQNGWLSADDIRELEDMNRLPEGIGNKYLVNGNMVEVAQAGAWNKEGKEVEG